jgi:hypothetical protein
LSIKCGVRRRVFVTARQMEILEEISRVVRHVSGPETSRGTRRGHESTSDSIASQDDEITYSHCGVLREWEGNTDRQRIIPMIISYPGVSRGSGRRYTRGYRAVLWRSKSQAINHTPFMESSYNKI